MNDFTVQKLKTEFVEKEHLSILIDDTPLDLLIADEDENGEVHSVGLVPTLLDWLTDENERKVTWDRILPADGKKTIAPILMCPEDRDLICTVVVAEVETRGTAVIWRRIGIDIGKKTGKPENVGKKVEWLELPEFKFPLSDYKKAIGQFSSALK
jgi:hypothetical protein